jgi:outer membrane lipoprotein carrier protein
MKGDIRMKAYILMIVSFIICVPLHAENVDQIIEKTLVHYENMETFYAEFDQKQCDEVRGICCDYTGVIYFKKPNFFRMEMKEPETIYVGDSVSLWIYMPESKHAIRQNLGEVPFQINPDMFLQDYQERFNAEMTGETDKVFKITLLPKENTDIYDHISLSIGKKDYQINAITICDQAGSENSFIFNKIVVNKNISKKKFKFDPPKGTTIDEY